MKKVRLCFHDRDRKSTRLNSSHSSISYAVFCLKKKTRIVGSLSQYPLHRFDDEPAKREAWGVAASASRPIKSLRPRRLRHRHVSFFLKQPATPEIYTLSLHDALPI